MSDTPAIGCKCWVVAGGRIPLQTVGAEPEFTSRDEVSILNAGGVRACISITIYYSNDEPVGPYEFAVEPRRIRRVRFNDLIFPEAVPLALEYSAILHSDVPVAVQFTRLDSSGDKSWACATPYPDSERPLPDGNLRHASQTAEGPSLQTPR
jgi:hypothetical protein